MLSEEKIKQIEKLIGSEDLQGAIDSPDIVDIKVSKTVSFTKQAYDELYNDLITKAYDNGMYNSAKQKGEEIAIKKAKKELGIEFEGKTIEHLLKYVQEQTRLAEDGSNEELEQKYISDINSLKEALTEKDSKYESLQNNIKVKTIDNIIDSYFNTLNIDVPASIKDEEEAKRYIALEKKRHGTFFKSQYDFELNEHDNILSSKSGQLLKDEKLQPIHIDNLLGDYTKTSFMNLKQEIKGRGEGDRLPGNGISNIKSMNELREYAESKGVKPNTSEMDALVIEFNKNNK